MNRILLSFRHRRAPEVVKHPVEMYFTFSSCTPCCQFFFVSEILGQSLETAWLRPLDINGSMVISERNMSAPQILPGGLQFRR